MTDAAVSMQYSLATGACQTLLLLLLPPAVEARADRCGTCAGGSVWLLLLATTQVLLLLLLLQVLLLLLAVVLEGAALVSVVLAIDAKYWC